MKKREKEIFQSEDLPPKEGDFYQKLRTRVREWEREKGSNHKFLEYAILAPDLFHLLVKLSLDSDVPRKHKAMLAFAVAYFLSPIDLVPDFIPVAGLLDDIALAAYVLNTLINSLDPEILRRNWAGEDDILETVQGILEAADEMVGKGLFRKIVKLVKSKF